MWAAASGKTANIALLISHGADVNAVAHKGFTPLFFALKSKVPEAASLLLEAGANAGAVLPDSTSVPEAAVLENNIPFAMRLVSRGADLNQRDREGKQLIHIAAMSGDAEFVKLVLSKGGDPNALTQPPPAQVAQAAPAANAGGVKLAAADWRRRAAQAPGRCHAAAGVRRQGWLGRYDADAGGSGRQAGRESGRMAPPWRWPPPIAAISRR